MKVDIPKQVERILNVFTENEYEIYIVGGAVRDILMGKLVYDWDFTTNATPEQILKLFDDAYYENEFGMVGVPNEKEGERPFEITTFRTEHGYSDSRRPDKVLWGKTLKEDLQRRDFAINAMAIKVESGKQPSTDKTMKGKKVKRKDKQTKEVEIIDYYKGQEDLNKKLIRAVGEPDKRFSEDALRMMRAVRIATELRFSIEEKTLSAIRKNAKNINKIAGERVRDELLKILKTPYAHEGIMLLKDAGLTKHIIPKFDESFDVQQKSPGRHHVYDVGTHSAMSLKFSPTQDPITKLAILIHDLGKVDTYKKLDNGTITFYNHEMESTKIAERISRKLRLSNKQDERLIRLVRWHQFSVNENQTDSAIRRFITNVGLENVTEMLALRTADRLGGGAAETSWRLEDFKVKIKKVQKQPFKVTDLKITGEDVMKKFKIKPGPKVGEILQTLFDMVVAKEIENNRKDLQKALNSIK